MICTAMYQAIQLHVFSQYSHFFFTFTPGWAQLFSPKQSLPRIKLTPKRLHRKCLRCVKKKNETKKRAFASGFQQTSSPFLERWRFFGEYLTFAFLRVFALPDIRMSKLPKGSYARELLKCMPVIRNNTLHQPEQWKMNCLSITRTCLGH